jgi:uncharacterized caspase-like protein
MDCAMTIIRFLVAVMVVVLPVSGCLQSNNLASSGPFATTAIQPENGAGFRNTGNGPVIQDRPVDGPTLVKLDQPGALPEGKRVALIIGNGGYGDWIGRLENPRNDANDLAAALKRVGFEVTLVTDVSRDGMTRAVLEFENELRDSAVGLFFYAGHAVQVNGRNFMIPTDSRLQVSDAHPDAIADYVALETVEIDRVLGRMGVAGTELNIVILDACRNNPFSAASRSVSRGLAQTIAPRGTFVAYATAPGNVAEDGVGRNSPYTGSLVKHLATPGLKLEDLFKEVRRDVAKQTDGRQTPWENSSVFGDFFFVPAAARSEPPEVAARPTTSDAPEKSDVIEAQQALWTLGHYKGAISGELDRNTTDAIRTWQSGHGLDASGELVKAQVPFMKSDVARQRNQVAEDNRTAGQQEPAPPAAVEPPAAATAPPGRNSGYNIIFNPP